MSDLNGFLAKHFPNVLEEARVPNFRETFRAHLKKHKYGLTSSSEGTSFSRYRRYHGEGHEPTEHTSRIEEGRFHYEREHDAAAEKALHHVLVNTLKMKHKLEGGKHHYYRGAHHIVLHTEKRGNRTFHGVSHYSVRHHHVR